MPVSLEPTLMLMRMVVMTTSRARRADISAAKKMVDISSPKINMVDVGAPKITNMVDIGAPINMFVNTSATGSTNEDICASETYSDGDKSTSSSKT